jgi:glycosyltransferase involved in cell wall biosynthesis
MLRCAIVPPVPVPYREPLLARLAALPQLQVRVIYQARLQRSWDQVPQWFPHRHDYDAACLESLVVPRAGRSPITWPRRLEEALSAFDPQVVVVSEFGPATLRALAWCRRRRRALVILTEVTTEVQESLPPPQRALQRFLARAADGLIAVSSAAAERLLELHVDPQRLSVSLQSVDEDAFDAAFQTRRPLHENPVEILAVARLVPDKNLRSLIEGFAAAKLTPEEASLTIVGSGPLEAQLAQLACDLALPVVLHPALPPDQLPALYARASAFALPSSFEPFGVALREAVISGLPLLCSTEVGAAKDLALEHENALMFAPSDVDGIARSLRLIVRDPQLRVKMGAASRRIALAHPLRDDVEKFAARISAAAEAAPLARV